MKGMILSGTINSAAQLLYSSFKSAPEGAQVFLENSHCSVARSWAAPFPPLSADSLITLYFSVIQVLGGHHTPDVSLCTTEQVSSNWTQWNCIKDGSQVSEEINSLAFVLLHNQPSHHFQRQWTVFQLFSLLFNNSSLGEHQILLPCTLFLPLLYNTEVKWGQLKLCWKWPYRQNWARQKWLQNS